jgi:Bacterial membrane protein YfhO
MRASLAMAGVTEPDHAMWWAAAVCALVTLVLAYPAFGGGFLVSTHSDQYLGAYAVRVFGTHTWLTTGRIPQWNPYLFGGLPYLAASQNGDVFYPTALLRVFLRGDIAVTWAFIIHEFLAGWFTYLFLRALGLSFYGALVGALAYMLGGPFASYVGPGHDGKMYVSALFPMIGMVALYAMRGGRLWAYPALAFLVGLGILTPHPQVMQYCLLGVGAIALYAVFWEKDPGDRVERRVAFQRIGLLVAAIAVGLLIGGIYYAPMISYIPYSPRAHGALPGYTPYDFAASYSMPPEEILNTYIPEFTGLFDNYFGRTGIHFQSEYIGAAVYMLAGAGVFGAASASKKRAVRFWLVVTALGFLWSLGGYTPFYHLVYWLVPGTKYFRAPAAFFFIPAFAIAVLAGEGVDAIMARRVSSVYVYVAAGVAAFIAVLAVSGALTTFGGTIAPAQLYDMVVANAPQVTFGAIRALIAVLIVAALIVLVQRQRLDPVIAACAMAAVVAVELWSVERLYWKFSPPASVIFASDAALDAVKREPQPARLLVEQLAEGGVAPGDAEVYYDLPMINGVRLVLGHHGNEIRRYDELLDHDDNYRQVLSPQMWRLLNIRFLLTNIDSLPVPGSAKVVGPEKDAAGSTLYLYRLPGDNPAAWVTPVAVKAPDDQTLATVRDPRFDPLRAAIFDTAARVPAVAGVKALPEPLPESVTVTRFEPGHMTYKLSAPAPANATLIASENYYPGWSATVDGKPEPTGRVDYTLIGVPLTAGATTVDLVYRDPALPTGERITFAALLVSAFWLALTLVRRPPREQV